MVLPLPDGRFALITDSRECVAVVDGALTLAELMLLVPDELADRLRRRKLEIFEATQREAVLAPTILKGKISL
jgi:hypothetical protein